MSTQTTVYRVICAGAVHYVRAVSRMHARVRAFKSWGENPTTMDDIGNHAPDIGARAYAEWVNTESMPTNNRELIAAQKRGPVNGSRALHYVSKKNAIKINNRAEELIKLLRLSA